MDSSSKNRLLIVALCGLLLYAVIAFIADLDELLAAGSRFPWLMFPFVMALACGNYIIRFLRWQLYLKKLGVALSIGNSAVVFFSGLTMSISPGKFGELLKAEYIKNINGTPRRRTAPIVIAERMTDLIGILFLASFGVFRFNYGGIVFFIVFALILLALLVMSSRKLSLWFIRLFRPVPFIGKRVPKLEEAYESITEISSPAILLGSTLLSVLAWGCESLGFYIVLNALPGVDISIGTAIFIYAFAILAGAVTLIPGGLLVTEGTMASLLVLLKVPAAEAILATLITRLATLWFAVILGLVITLLFYKLLDYGGREAVNIDKSASSGHGV